MMWQVTYQTKHFSLFQFMCIKCVLQSVRSSVFSKSLTPQDHFDTAFRRLGAKGSYLTLVRVADRIILLRGDDLCNIFHIAE